MNRKRKKKCSAGETIEHLLMVAIDEKKKIAGRAPVFLSHFPLPLLYVRCVVRSLTYISFSYFFCNP